MKFSLEHVPAYLVLPQKLSFLLYCTEEANGVDWPVTSLKITASSPFLQWEPKENKNVVFVVFFSTFCGAVEKQQDLYSFQLIAALRDSTKKYRHKIYLIQMRNCSLAYAYVF